VVLVLLVVGMVVVDSFHVVDLLVDPAQLLVTNVEVCAPKFLWDRSLDKASRELPLSF
jgi:hypothetical protein